MGAGQHLVYIMIKIIMVCRPVARIFAGRVHMSASGVKCQAPQARARRGVWGILPHKILKKWVHLRPHFVRF